jgi:hypothetical protein
VNPSPFMVEGDEQVLALGVVPSVIEKSTELRKPG